MSRLLMLTLMLAAALGCTDTASDLETGDPFAGSPDIVGTYTVALSEVIGCDGDAAGLAWLSDGFTIAGDPSALDLTTAAGVLPGTVDPSAAWEFGGALGTDAGDLAVSASGVASDNDGTPVLDGTVEVTVSNADDTCDLSAVLLATRMDG